jgi:hypothetical protein
LNEATARPVLAQAESLIAAIGQYEAIVGPGGYRPTLSHVIQLHAVAGAGLALEQALTAAGFLGHGTTFGHNAVLNGGLFVPLAGIAEVVTDIRLSRHAATPADRQQVLNTWGQRADGGWGFHPQEDKQLPRLASYAARLEPFVAMLREALSVEPSTSPVKATPKTPAEDRPQGSRLNPTDRAILDTLQSMFLDGVTLAQKLNRDYDYVRHRLVELENRGLVRRTTKGYEVIKDKLRG